MRRHISGRGAAREENLRLENHTVAMVASGPTRKAGCTQRKESGRVEIRGVDSAWGTREPWKVWELRAQWLFA